MQGLDLGDDQQTVTGLIRYKGGGGGLGCEHKTKQDCAMVSRNFFQLFLLAPYAK